MIQKNLIRIGLIALAVAHSDASANFFARFATLVRSGLKTTQPKPHMAKRLALTTAIASGTGLMCKDKIANAPEDQTELAPIFYQKKYNISPFWGLEKALHAFDGCKYGKIAAHLQKIFAINRFRSTGKVTDADLEKVHEKSYLATLNNSATIARIVEVPILRLFPASFLQYSFLDPMRYATQGTVEAARAALQHGWAINLSGGYHHAKSDRGGGFCVFNDALLAAKKLRESNPGLKILIIDFDAHAGNGNADPNFQDGTKLTYIFDMYNRDYYPLGDNMQHVDFPHGLKAGIKTEQYLSVMKKNLPQAIEKVKPDLIIYNAGTDIYEKDPLGGMSVSKQGIIERDEFVFQQARGGTKPIPIVMILSGGYTPESASIIGESIENFVKKNNLVPIREPKLDKK